MRDNKPICALYCRVARESADTIELQKSRLAAYAREMGYTNTVAYLDNGYSGLDADRPGLTKLNADIEAGKVGAVLAVSMSRLWRNYAECGAWMGSMDKKGVTVLFQQDPAMYEQAHELHAAFENLYKRKKKKHARHTVRTPPPVSKTH